MFLSFGLSKRIVFFNSLLLVLACQAPLVQSLDMLWKEHDLQLSLPKHWQATQPKQNERLFITAPELAAVIIIEHREVFNQVLFEKEFSKPQRSSALTFWPLGSIKSNDNSIAIDYVGHNDDAKLFHAVRVVTRPGSRKTFVIAGTIMWSERQQLESVLQGLKDSFLMMSKTTTLDANSNNVDISPWHDVLINQELQQFRSKGGEFYQKSLYLCEGGEFRFQETSSVNPDAVPIEVGEWRVEQLDLVLAWQSGSTSRYSLKQDGEKWLLNGEQWFRKATDICAE